MIERLIALVCCGATILRPAPASASPAVAEQFGQAALDLDRYHVMSLEALFEHVKPASVWRCPLLAANKETETDELT